jgi:hypothetical protein
MNVHAEQNVNCWVGNRYYGPDGQKVSGLSKKKRLKKATKKEKSRKKRLIIVGASRVYHMAEHVSNDKRTIYICKKGAAYKWLKENAHKYGFILRFPEDKTGVTGYSYESWHYRYVGVEHAKEIHKKGITLEEYLEK